MKLSNLIFTKILIIFFLALGINHAWAQAPNSIVGKKFVLSIPDSENQREYGITWVFTSEEDVWELEHENGDWQYAKYEFVKSGSQITLKTVPYNAGGSYDQFILNYSNSVSGDISYTAFEKNDSGTFEIDEEGSATFTMSDYSNADLPPFDIYFSDDFTNSSHSNNYWYENTETSWYGLHVNIGNGKLELTGTGSDLEERWFDMNTKSVLPVNQDWVIEGDAYADYPSTGNETWSTVLGFEAEYQSYDFEFFVGPSSWGTHAYISYEDPGGTFVHISATFGNEKTGSYRVRNDTITKTFYAEYLDGGSWEEAISVNWQSGAITGATYSSNENTSQLSNWISLENYKVQPGVDFMIPSDDTTVSTITSNQLGFKSFSITEGSPVSDIAPSSLNGVKITSNLTIDGVGTETRIGWIDAEGTYWDKDEDGNGQWYPAGVEYTKTGHDQAENFIGTRNNSYREGVITFDSPSSGTYTFEYWDSEGTNPLVKVADGYGDFTTEPIDNEDLPVDRYFLDNFSSSSSSEINWPIHTHNGITNHLYENAFSLSGTISDPSHQNHDVNAHSILSIQKDWVIHGTPIADLNDDGSLSFQSAVGVDFEIKDGSEEFELSIGLSEEGIFSEINTSARPGKNREMQKNSGSAYGASKFRIINSASEKKISSQYLLSGNWNTVHELNWETGEYSETDILSGQTTNSQIANWVTYQEAYGSPMMDFQLPSTRNSNGEASFLFLQSGDLGFEEFGVSEDLPLSIPPSLQNKKITITYETESGSSGTNYNYFLDDDTVKVHYLAGTEDAFWDEESYTWSESGNNQASSSITNSEGRVVTGELNFESEETGTFTLKFYEPSNGELVYQESATGTFTISDFTAEELPVSKGWMWFDHYPWVYSHVEGGWLYFMPSGSKLMVYSVKDEAWREMTE